MLSNHYEKTSSVLRAVAVAQPWASVQFHARAGPGLSAGARGSTRRVRPRSRVPRVGHHRRYVGLDALRGYAAVVVVLFHVVLLYPSWDRALAAAGHLQHGRQSWALLNALVHLPTAGHEAVLVFFVLSGFVLTRATLGSSAREWVGYFPRRMARLYLPVIGAVLVAAPQVLWLRPGPGQHGGSYFYATHLPASGADLVDAATLRSRPPMVDTPLWSLHWEMLFSLLLPAFLVLVVARRFAGLAAVTALAMVASSALGMHYNGARQYLPVFALGVLLYARCEDVERLARSHGRGVLLAGAGCFVVPWTSLALHQDMRLAGVREALVALGAACVVVSCVAGRVADCVSGRVGRWLGKRSFSIYLVHEPILVTLTFLLGYPPVWLLLPLAVPVVLLVAEGFGRLVEEPAVRFARRVGGAVAAPRTTRTPRRPREADDGAMARA